MNDYMQRSVYILNGINLGMAELALWLGRSNRWVLLPSGLAASALLLARRRSDCGAGAAADKGRHLHAVQCALDRPKGKADGAAPDDAQQARAALAEAGHGGDVAASVPAAAGGGTRSVQRAWNKVCVWLAAN